MSAAAGPANGPAYAGRAPRIGSLGATKRLTAGSAGLRWKWLWQPLGTTEHGDEAAEPRNGGGGGFATGMRPGQASAQYYPIYPLTPPPYTHLGNQAGLSPYLNLLRGGDPSANYYAGVVPAFQNRATSRTCDTAIQEVEAQSTYLRTEGLELGRPLDQTGHPTAFGYYSSYYPQLGRGSSVGMPGVGVGASGGYRPR